MLHKKLQNSQKNLSLWVPPHNPKIGPQAQNQNPLYHGYLACQLVSKMVCHDLVAPMTMELLHFREKNWVQAKAYQVRIGQEHYPPKSYLKLT